MTKKKIRSTKTLDFNFETIDEAIEELQKVKKELERHEIKHVHTECSGYESSWLDIEYEREETDSEYEHRTQTLKRLEEAKEKLERKKLAELKAKYE